MKTLITPPDHIRDLAIFLEKMNNKSSSHIGFCGEDRGEIYDHLMNDFSDLEVKDSFLVAYNHSRIVGAIGLDMDLKRGCADVWGPFVEGEDIDMAQELWETIASKTPPMIKTFSFFLNEDNHFGKEFVLQNKGINQGSDLVLSITRDRFINHTPSDVETYSDAYRQSFINLHNEVFPTTYFDAHTIISRLNDFNHLFFVTENEHDIKGYVYIEANPKHMEANIEYIAVSTKLRKQGIGKTLIRVAIDHLFSYSEIKEITICVGGDNIAAIHLYKSVGFMEKYKLISYDIVRH
ncbi:GNAT family N-acetyltransferase [Shouchella clausii]|uniref:GNAT family acetyltransferase n=2 Tax=Shouchella clausii TaxID=79880 RepID=Q5WLK1_SHOC1|nr:N-acetyltransferase [Shouchella clausii]KKI86297.1 hypothetical protein WZ76_11055 [Shouchella clausii]BAD62754.1 GNAT family acetyltransferase [Shouchella clausii KSM-K16]